MTVFDLYAAYYDLLYHDKDYSGETAYLVTLIGEAAPHARSVLELGCGTGGHALQFAELGFQVHGIDLSDSMVARARLRCAAAAEPVAARLAFEVGDVRSFRAGRTFDAVVSLFHVMSYQTGNEDQAAAFATARGHLDTGGVFVFDFWYGPAVLTDRPRHVIKEVADERVEVRRETTPTMHVNSNRVDVRFDVDIASRSGDATRRLSEIHRMRYLFLPEIEQRLHDAGFALLSAQAWMTRQPLDDRSWYGCVVARAI
jgi:SAM-dependent methyltransferase